MIKCISKEKENTISSMKIWNTFHVNMFPCNERLRFTVTCVKDSHFACTVNLSP